MGAYSVSLVCMTMFNQALILGIQRKIISCKKEVFCSVKGMSVSRRKDTKEGPIIVKQEGEEMNGCRVLTELERCVILTCWCNIYRRKRRAEKAACSTQTHPQHSAN